MQAQLVKEVSFSSFLFLLFQHGASVNLPNNQGNTPLHKAVIGNYEAVVQVLLQNGALVHLRNNKQCTPLDYAEPVSGAWSLRIIIYAKKCLNLHRAHNVSQP